MKPVRGGYDNRFTPTHVGTANRAFITRRQPEVHPHACGDSGGRGGEMGERTGSPPRMWGQLPEGMMADIVRPVHPHACGDSVVDFRIIHNLLRFTPTHVGTANVADKKLTVGQVHPHACGDSDDH